MKMSTKTVCTDTKFISMIYNTANCEGDHTSEATIFDKCEVYGANKAEDDDREPTIGDTKWVLITEGGRKSSKGKKGKGKKSKK